MAAPREETLRVRGCDIHLRLAGSGRPLLFLHGPQGYVGWPRFLDRLSERFRVIAPDHPGFGRSDRPDWIETVSDLAYFYMDLVERLELGDVHIVGNSLGAWTALDMAIRDRSAIAAMTLIAAAGIHVKGAQKADMFIVSPEALVRLLYVDEGVIARRLEEERDPALVTRLNRNRIMAAKLCWQPRLYDPHLARWLHRVQVPVHLVWGDRDRVIPPLYAAAFEELLPDAEVTMIPGAGHLPHVERPDDFLAAFDGFVERRRTG